MMRWALLALVGVVLAAGAAYAASRLATQPIALESEPITAGESLAPRSTPARSTPVPTRTPGPTPTATTSPEGEDSDDDDDSGRGRGRGRGRGGDDDD